MTARPRPVSTSPGLVGVLAALAVTGAAVPAAGVAQDTTGTPRQAWIGIRFTTETAPSAPVLRTSFQLLVDDIYPNSPADLAGIVPGDWFVSVDGNPLSTFESWLRSTSNLRPGQSVRLIVVRNGDQHDVTVVADPAPAFVIPNPLDRLESAWARFDSIFDIMLSDPLMAEPWPWHVLPGIPGITSADEMALLLGQARAEREAFPSVGGGGTELTGVLDFDSAGGGRRSVFALQLEGTVLLGGVLLRDLTADLGRSIFGVERGVLVTDVMAMSPGLYAGFRPGDVIVSVEEKAFENINDLRRLLSEFHTPIELTVIRQKNPVKIVYPRPDR